MKAVAKYLKGDKLGGASKAHQRFFQLSESEATAILVAARDHDSAIEYMLSTMETDQRRKWFSRVTEEVKGEYPAILKEPALSIEAAPFLAKTHPPLPRKTEKTKLSLAPSKTLGALWRRMLGYARKTSRGTRAGLAATFAGVGSVAAGSWFAMRRWGRNGTGATQRGGEC